MRILFLDIDGVLNSSDFYQSGRWDPHRGIESLDPLAMKCLAEILEPPGGQEPANIVVSSTWRYGRSLMDLQRILERSGLPSQFKIVGKTPGNPVPVPCICLSDSSSQIDSSSQGTCPVCRGKKILPPPDPDPEERGYEIQLWLDGALSLKDSDLEGFCILDDDGDMAHLKSHWVWTFNTHGLLPHHVPIAREILWHGRSSMNYAMAHVRNLLERMSPSSPSPEEPEEKESKKIKESKEDREREDRKRGALWKLFIKEQKNYSLALQSQPAQPTQSTQSTQPAQSAQPTQSAEPEIEEG